MENRQFEALLNLGLSEEEAKQVLADDKRIDKGEKLFELSEEGKQAEKKMRQADRKPTIYKFDKKERKPNEEKRVLMDLINHMLIENSMENITILNPEREIEFNFGGKKYKIVLSAPRK